MESHNVKKRLDQAHEAADDLQPLYEKIGGAMVFRTQRRFETETDPAGKKWPRLKPRTAAKRIGSGRRGYENMLRVKLRLYQSITYQADATSVATGTNVIYAAIQNLGGEIKQAERQHTIYQKYNEKTDTLAPRFVKRSRSNYARDVTIKARTIKIPAREFLGFGDGDRKEVLSVTEGHFRTEGGFEGGNQ
ncbi:phage virion morphogenesis protein [Phyllobacterium phragmitis]|uniref:Phage virion morphogenesis protein n=2 Tax=Phyllobacterium phragmitis TaxID=2670329 RepID=A0A2S9IXX7_9HYPH|nr:phage virion morphogenesis protein [Phyllobacterium phragmitis]